MNIDTEPQPKDNAELAKQTPIDDRKQKNHMPKNIQNKIQAPPKNKKKSKKKKGITKLQV